MDIPVVADISTHGASVTRLWSDRLCVGNHRKGLVQRVKEKQRHLLIMDGGL